LSKLGLGGTSHTVMFMMPAYFMLASCKGRSPWRDIYVVNLLVGDSRDGLELSQILRVLPWSSRPSLYFCSSGSLQFSWFSQYKSSSTFCIYFC